MGGWFGAGEIIVNSLRLKYLDSVNVEVIVVVVFGPSFVRSASQLVSSVIHTLLPKLEAQFIFCCVLPKMSHLIFTSFVHYMFEFEFKFKFKYLLLRKNESTCAYCSIC